MAGHPKKRDPESEIRLTVFTHALARVRASSLPLSFFFKRSSSRSSRRRGQSASGSTTT